MNQNISIVLSGSAGQGIKTVEDMFMQSLREYGYHFFVTSEVMSRVRGGNNTTEIRIGAESISSYSEQIDFLIVLGKNALYRLEERMSNKTIIIGDAFFIDDAYKQKYKVKEIPINAAAEEAGSLLYVNSVIYGLLIGMLHIPVDAGIPYIESQFAKKGSDIIERNIAALKKGVELAQQTEISVSVPTYDAVKNRRILCGNDAMTIGALAGGCNFVSAYPMSPGTTLLIQIAQQAKEHGIVVEQAEDEIAAINMAIGSWYAGARGLTTTSGGGFALMEEGISLSGMTECPVVVHLAQRPGPATGLPTRTEQGDLNLAVYAGHGEFPKVVFAPGTLEDGIRVMHKAFNIADACKIPVIVLTDQFFLESYMPVDTINLHELNNQYYIHKTEADYKTYEITPLGISKRGIPGYGEGLVCMDSDEHDEWGRLTESADVRVAQMDKRLRKNKIILEHSIEPRIIGNQEYDTLIIGWGSTHGVLTEALQHLTNQNIAYAYFAQVYPLPKTTEHILSKAKKIISIENNATGQFARLIRQETGYKADHQILQYNGSPFSVEYIVSQLKSLVL